MASDFYRLTEMDKHNPNYAVLLGERANGKSGAVKERLIEKALEKQTIVGGLVRRLDEDIKASVIKSYFNDSFLIDKIKKLSKINIIIYTITKDNFTLHILTKTVI